MTGRLIDEDELISILGFENTQEEREENVGEIITLEDIDRIPTAYDPDKVVEQLEAYSNADEAEQAGTIPVIELEDAIKIVKAGEADEL